MKEELKATAIEKAVLDSYFSNRDHVYDQLVFTVEERKTTQQIQDDLRPTLTIADDVIVEYMLQKGYMLVQDDDGSPIWQMWKMK